MISVVVADDGHVYVGYRDGAIEKFAPDGDMLWTEDASDDRLHGMELGPDGNVHAASWADEVIKISPDRTVVWRTEADGRVATRPC